MQKIIGMLFLFGAFTLAGSCVVAVRFIDGRLGTFTITSISLCLAVLFLLPSSGRAAFAAIRKLSRLEWIELFLQAVFGVFLYRMLLLFGMQSTSSAEAGLLTGTTPAITVLLSILVLKERMNRQKFLGILFAISGVLLIQNLASNGTDISLTHLAGNVLVIGSAASESLFNTFSRIAAVKRNNNSSTKFSPAVQTLIVCVIAIILCVIPTAFENPVSSIAQASPQTWLSLAWYGIPVTAIAYIFWYSGIKRCEVSTAAAFSGMVPFTSLVLSTMILGERAAPIQWVGGALIIVSMICIGRSDRCLSEKVVLEEVK